MTQRVYISSTYKDLIQERKRVIDAIAKLPGYQPIHMETSCSDSQFPLEKCREDVRTSDFYVGILGWRAGFVPAGEDHAITELEYEAALKAQIPCLFFLLGDEQEPQDVVDKQDLERIKSLRARVSTRHAPRRVKAGDELGEDVIAALFDQALRKGGVRRPAPDAVDLRPYTCCDRQLQRQAMRPGLSSAQETVLTYAIHGHQEQLPDYFLEWLASGLLEQLLGKPAGSLKELRVEWPVGCVDDQTFATQLTYNLADAAQVPAAEQLTDRLQKRLRAFPGYYISLNWHLDNFHAPDLERMAALSRYFQNWAREARPQVLILWLTYKAAAGRSWWPWSNSRAALERRVQDALKRLHVEKPASFITTPQLEDVCEEDVMAWVRSANRLPANRARREEAVRSLFSRHKRDRLPMLTLVRELAECDATLRSLV